MNAHMTSLRLLAVAVFGVATLCAPARTHAGSGPSGAQAPSVQTRAFATASPERALRAAMATLQDFGFVIEKADSAAGSITAVKIEKYPLRMTVTVQVRGSLQVLVHADAQYEGTPVTAPKLYQDFFAELDDAMSLKSHAAD